MKILHSFGKKNIDSWYYEERNAYSNEIKIQTKYCGICNSDIAVYGGFETPMFLGKFGHEGLGVVVSVGKEIKNVKEGDFVSTISDPAYSEFYFAKENEFVKVPELNQKYIIQPVACALNILQKTLNYNKNNKDILLVGSGFMSLIIAEYCTKILKIKIDICGSSNKKNWGKLNLKLNNIEDIEENSYDYVIDLSSKAENFKKITNICKNEGIINYASTPKENIVTNFFENCWKCHTILMPSPRNSDFIKSMELSVELIKNNILNTEELWSKGFKMFSEYKEGFEAGLNRDFNYIRGYFYI